MMSLILFNNFSFFILTTTGTRRFIVLFLFSNDKEIMYHFYDYNFSNEFILIFQQKQKRKKTKMKRKSDKEKPLKLFLLFKLTQ